MALVRHIFQCSLKGIADQSPKAPRLRSTGCSVSNGFTRSPQSTLRFNTHNSPASIGGYAVTQASTTANAATTQSDLKTFLKERAEEFVRSLIAWEETMKFPNLDSIGPAEVVKSKDDLVDLLHWLRWAMAAYKADTKVLTTTLGLTKDSDLLKHNLHNSEFNPVYYIALDHAKKLVVFGVRGTISKKDVVTDITGISVPFDAGFAHTGMLLAAQNLLKAEKKLLEKTLKEFSDYQLVITGHSLGAGVSTLMTLILKSERGFLADKVTSWGFGCPPVVDNNQAKKAASFIKVVVDLNDVVPRVGVDSLRELIEEIIQFRKSIGEAEFKAKIQSLLDPISDMKSALIDYATNDPASSATTDSGKLGDAIASLHYQGVSKDQSVSQAFLEAVLQFETLLKEKLVDIVEDNKPTWLKWLSWIKIPQIKIPFIESAIEKQRLYVPGTLHHIKRADGLTAGTMDGLSPDAEQVLMFWTGEFETADAMKAIGENDDDVFVVERGVIQDRFRKIKVSETMIDDHACDNYGNGLYRALLYI